MIFFYRNKYDYIKFSGKDRLDLLHRLSTNDVKDLSAFKGKKTILTTDKGKIVDLLTLYNFEDFIFSSCSFNNAGNVIKHLDKYTIIEDFKAENLAGTHETILFFGDLSNLKSLSNLLFMPRPIEEKNLSNNDFSIYSIDGKEIIIARNDDLFGGFNFIYAKEDKEAVENRVLSSRELQEIYNDKYKAFRIEKGIPEFGKEMGENSNPLECNLSQYVSFTKGCYIGQEVIARLDTYDKISKHLVGIESSEKFFDETLLSELKIINDNGECGNVTSTAESERYGYIGLGFIKSAFLDYEKKYKIKRLKGYADCKIVKLPF